MNTTAFQERSGKLSITRIIYAVAIILIILVWGTVCIMTRTVQTFPVAVVAALIAGKTIQRYVENKTLPGNEQPAAAVLQSKD